MSQLTIVILIKEVLVASGIIHLIQRKYPNTLIETCSSLSDLSSKSCAEPRVFILDPKLLDAPEKVSMEKLYTRNAACKFLALSPEPLPDNLLPYFDATISYHSAEKEIMAKLATVLNSQEVQGERPPAASLISDREKEVLRGVALGKTNNEISNTLHISSHTVITHRKNISAKLGIKTIAGLAIYAVLNGIIAPEEMDSI